MMCGAFNRQQRQRDYCGEDLGPGAEPPRQRRGEQQAGHERGDEPDRSQPAPDQDDEQAHRHGEQAEHGDACVQGPRVGGADAVGCGGHGHGLLLVR
ncbi:MAG: hypothetical protein M3O70_05420 [Actinomycetota bacterium]|nr:hypothetical protein [Actinomycetota bacterium]